MSHAPIWEVFIAQSEKSRLEETHLMEESLWGYLGLEKYLRQEYRVRR